MSRCWRFIWYERDAVSRATTCVMASKKTNHPVKWYSDRSEAFLSDTQGRDLVIDAELALQKWKISWHQIICYRKYGSLHQILGQ